MPSFFKKIEELNLKETKKIKLNSFGFKINLLKFLRKAKNMLLNML